LKDSGARSGPPASSPRWSPDRHAGAQQYVAAGGDHGWTDFATEAAAVLRFAAPYLNAQVFSSAG